MTIKALRFVFLTIGILFFNLSAVTGDDECVQIPHDLFDIYPAPGSDNIPLITNISVSFSRLSPPVAELKISPETTIRETIRKGNSTDIGQPSTITFIFDKPLLPNTTYNATVIYRQQTTLISGEKICLIPSRSWQFTTEDLLPADISIWDFNHNNRIEKPEAIASVVAYFEGLIDKETVLDVLDYFFTQIRKVSL